MNLPLGGVSVLAIDDDRSALEALTLVLESSGAQVFPMSSAATALAFRDTNESLDVIVSDITRPGTDGLEMMASMRAAETAAGRGATPAIAMSGHHTPEDKERALVAGYQVHMAKPLKIALLLTTISELAGRSDGAL